MEIEGEDGSTTHLTDSSEVVFGRNNGFDQNDPTVSRRHITFKLTPTNNHSTSQTAPRVSFEVFGKNPMWVRAKQSGEIRAFRRFERGQLIAGDLFCVSSNNPVWFTLKKVGDDVREIGELGDGLEFEGLIGNGFGLDLDSGFESIDFSNIDPVKEFGFLVIGHEFDNYPKGVIRDVKSWNWFLEDRGQDSADDEDESYGKGKKPLRQKRKKSGKEEDDEEWTGESQDEEALTRAKKPHAPKYSTRSKDHGRGMTKKDSGSQKGSAEKRSKRVEEEEDDEEEGDETLGGFIVGDDDAEGEMEEVSEDGEEEEEFEEDEDDYV